MLVVAEVALALTLLTGAGLLIKSFARLQGVDPGFDPERLLTFNLSLPPARYQSDTAQIAFFDQVMPARVRRARRARGRGHLGDAIRRRLDHGRLRDRGLPDAAQAARAVGGHPDRESGLLRDAGHSASARPAARRSGSRRRARGRRHRRGVRSPLLAARRSRSASASPSGRRRARPTRPSREWIEVVGVVGHTKQEGLDAENRLQLYLPYRPVGTTAPHLRASAPRAGPSSTSTRCAARCSPSIPTQPLSGIRSMDELIARSVGQRRLSMMLLSLFSGIALVLASVGIYGLMSYSVAQRSRELGVRIALGAARLDVLRLVLRQGMSLALTGIVIGVGAAFALSRVIESQLFGVARDRSGHVRRRGGAAGAHRPRGQSDSSLAGHAGGPRRGAARGVTGARARHRSGPSLHLTWGPFLARRGDAVTSGRTARVG